MITKKTKIGEMLKEKPKGAKILMEEGIFCAGCPGAAQETIEHGLKAHGKTDKEIEKIIKKINAAK